MRLLDRSENKFLKIIKITVLALLPIFLLAGILSGAGEAWAADRCAEAYGNFHEYYHASNFARNDDGRIIIFWPQDYNGVKLFFKNSEDIMAADSTSKLYCGVNNDSSSPCPYCEKAEDTVCCVNNDNSPRREGAAYKIWTKGTNPAISEELLESTADAMLEYIEDNETADNSANDGCAKAYNGDYHRYSGAYPASPRDINWGADGPSSVRLLWKSEDDKLADNNSSLLFCGTSKNDSSACAGCDTGAQRVCCVRNDRASRDLPEFRVLYINNGLDVYQELKNMAVVGTNAERCCCYKIGTKDEDCAWIESNFCPDGMESSGVRGDQVAGSKCGSSVDTVLQIPIPQIGGTSLRFVESYGQYVNTIYQWMIAVAGILAVVVITIAGFQWVLAAGNQAKITQAKGKIKNSLLAILFLSASYIILAMVNPQLLSLDIKVKPVPTIALDIKTPSGGGTGGGETITQEEGDYMLADAGITVHSSGNCNDRKNRNCTSLEGMRMSTISEIIRLKEDCGDDCVIVVTAGTETGHSGDGVGSHAGGYKFDLRVNDDSNRIIRSYTPTFSNRSDVTETYEGPGGVIYAYEFVVMSNGEKSYHWDVLVP